MTGRLDRIRGGVPVRRHNARTIAALTRNPGCSRRAVVDAAGVDKERLARHVGFPAPFGQSRFAITRGNAFEAHVKADGCAELLRLLGDLLGLELPAVSYAELSGEEGNEVRHARTRAALTGQGGSLFDHPLLRLDVAGRDVYLEPDLVAFRHGGVFHVVEVKSFPVIDGQADGEKVAAAAIQSAVYVLALRRLLGSPAAVSSDVVLVCPKDFSNTPTAALVDVRKQLIVLEHQLARLARVDALLEALPPDLTLDPALPADEVAKALGQVPARYAPDCLATCELSYFCRDEARGCTAALGVGVREELGGVETVAEVLALAPGSPAPGSPAPGSPVSGSPAPGEDQADAAALLRTAARLYRSAVAS